MTDGDRLNASVSDAAVHEMVADLRPEWRVTSIDRVPEGTDFVAVLEVATTDGSSDADRQERRCVVLKATAADLVPAPVARAEPRSLGLVDRETSIPVPSVFGYRDAHPEHPAPFYLLEYVEARTWRTRRTNSRRTLASEWFRTPGPTSPHSTKSARFPRRVVLASTTAA